MRTVNIRRLIVLIVLVVVLAGATHWLHGYQVRRNVGMFLREAHRAQESRRPMDTIENLSWYLRLVPEDTEVEVELGTLLADMGRNGPAFMTLENALRREPQRADVRRRLVKVALELHRPGDARAHLEQYLLKAAPEDAELLDLLGQCQEAQGAYAQALVSWDRSLRASGERLELHARRASLLRQRLGRTPEADAAMERMVENHPRTAEVYRLRSRYWAEGKQPEAALRDAQKALELSPDDVETLQLASVTALEQRQYDQAAEYAQRALALQPQQPQVYLTLSAVSMGKRDRAEAIQWLRRGLEAIPVSMELQWNLANTLLEDGQLEQAETLAQQLNEAELPEALIGFLRARLLHARQQWRQASRMLEQLRPALQEWPELVKQSDGLLGDCYQRLGNADLQLAAYRRALEADPFWEPARLGVAEALVALGRQEEALAEYRRVAESHDSPAESWFAYIRLLIASNLRQPPAQRNWEKLEQALQQAATAASLSNQVAILRAEVLVAQGRTAEAETCLAQAIERQPGQVDLWEARIALAQRQEDWSRVQSLLDEARAAVGESLGWRLARARYLVVHRGKEAAAELRQLADARDGLSEEDQRRLVRQLASFSLEVGDYEQTDRLARWLAEKEPNDVTLELLRFERARRCDDRPALEAALEQIARIEGSGPLWLYHRAVYLSLCDDGQHPERLEEAQQQLVQARVLRPAWSDVPALAADLYLRQGKEDQAIPSYLEAIALGNHRPAVIRRAVLLLNQKERYVDASRVLRHLEEQAIPLSPELKRVAAEISLQTDEFDRAVAWARRTADGSSDYRDHLWLGLVLSAVAQRTAGPSTEAEACFRHALELDDSRPECWSALAQFLAQSGKVDQAEQVLTEASQKLPVAVAALVSAQCYDSLGRRGEAAQRYEEALATLGKDPSVLRHVIDFHLRRGDHVAAEPYLRKIVDGTIHVNEDDLYWARRNLALVLLARGDYSSLDQAAETIRANLAATPPKSDDLRAYSLILGSYPQQERRREAVQLLEKLLATQTNPAAEDRFVLAQLYLAQGDWMNANRQMRTLLASHGDEARYVVSYIRSLLEHQELGEVELWLPRLEKIAPADFTTAQLRAEHHFRRGRYDEVLSVWDAFLQQPATEEPTRPARVAADLESQGMRLAHEKKTEAAARFTDRAEQLYRQYVAQRPEHVLVLTSFCARQKRHDEAVANLEAHWRGADADLLAAAIGTLLANTEVEHPAIRAAERVLEAALKEAEQAEPPGKPISLLLTAADLRTAQGRYADAEMLLRQVLIQEPTHVMAMNNLALVLAAQKRELAQAKQLIDRVVERDGPKAAYLDSRATICLALGDAKQAVRDLSEALVQSPTAIRYFHQALAQQRLGQSKEAAEAFRRAQQMGLTAGQLPLAEREELARLEEILR